METIKTLAISFGASALTVFVVLVLLSLARRRFATEPVEAAAQRLDTALPRAAVAS